MIDYPALRAVHVTCVAVSYALFFASGVWMIRDSRMLKRRWVRGYRTSCILCASRARSRLPSC